MIVKTDGSFAALAISVRDKAKLGSRGVYLISIYSLECGEQRGLCDPEL